MKRHGFHGSAHPTVLTATTASQVRSVLAPRLVVSSAECGWPVAMATRRKTVQNLQIHAIDTERVCC